MRSICDLICIKPLCNDSRKRAAFCGDRKHVIPHFNKPIEMLSSMTTEADYVSMLSSENSEPKASKSILKSQSNISTARARMESSIRNTWPRVTANSFFSIRS